MERIRRRKLCRNLKHVKRLCIYRRTKMAGYDVIDEVSSTTGCSNDVGLHHPYDDDIHWGHALTDLLTSVNGLMCKFYKMLEPYFDNDLYRHMYEISLFDLSCFFNTVKVIYNTDKRKEICHKERSCRPRIATSESCRNTQVPSCGNYVDFADVLVDMARQMVSSSKNKHERKRNMNKLNFFKAMNRMRSIHLEWIYNGYNIDD